MAPTLYPESSAHNNRFQASPSLGVGLGFNQDGQGKVLGVQWTEGGTYDLARTGDVELPPELSISRSNSDLQLELIGDAGKVYVIEASADLRTWAPVSTSTVEDGLVKLSPAGPITFYRARE